MTLDSLLTEHAILEHLRSLIMQVVAETDRDTLNPAAITSSTHLLSLPLDSLATMELMAGIEARFSIFISDQQALNFVTLSEIIQYVQTRAAASIPLIEPLLQPQRPRYD